jgi:hypothetical protein
MRRRRYDATATISGPRERPDKIPIDENQVGMKQ